MTTKLRDIFALTKEGTPMRKAIRSAAVVSLAAVAAVVSHPSPTFGFEIEFWVPGGTVVVNNDVAVPTGPARSEHRTLCEGSGACPQNCPAPVQSFVFINTDGGRATRLTNIVVAAEVTPGTRCTGLATEQETCQLDGFVWVRHVAEFCE